MNDESAPKGAHETSAKKSGGILTPVFGLTELDLPRVAEELQRLRIQKAAQQVFKVENEPIAPPFDSGTLTEILARPPDAADRVAGLIPWEASTLIVAQRKTGKTTLLLNLVRSLITGDDFLDNFEVKPVWGNIAIMNYEVSAAMLARWARDVGIDSERLYLVNLRGRRNPLTHPSDRARLANDLREHEIETIIVDPFGRAFTGKNQNDSAEVGAFLVDLDLFARGEAGALDLVLSAHAGWNGERSRGSSALEDWADSIITMTRDPEDETKRYLKAIGRDVEIDEDLLNFDPIMRSLSMSGTGSRKKGQSERKTLDLVPFVVQAARDEPGIGVAGLEKAVRAMDDAPKFQPGEVSKSAKRAAVLGLLRIEQAGSGKKTSHFLATPYDPLLTPYIQPLSTTNPYIGIGVVVEGVSEALELPNLKGVTANSSLKGARCTSCQEKLSTTRIYYNKTECESCEVVS